LYAKRVITPQPLGPVAYGDVKAWMQSESPVRLALSRQWRSRASDAAFRAEVDANLSAHMEWERVIHPERFLPKKPREARPSGPHGPNSPYAPVVPAAISGSAVPAN